MISGLAARIAASRRARAALGSGLIFASVLLFLLSIRRSGERTGRLLERLEAMEKVNEVRRDRMLAALAAGLASGDLAAATLATLRRMARSSSPAERP